VVKCLVREWIEWIEPKKYLNTLSCLIMLSIAMNTIIVCLLALSINLITAAPTSSAGYASTSTSPPTALIQRNQRLAAAQRPAHIHTNPQQPDIQYPQPPNPLVKTVSTVSIGLLFMLLVWRNLSVYELADQFTSNRMRSITIIPMMAILAANIIGFLICIFRPQGFKNQLKAILAVNSVREGVELIYNIVKVFGGSRYSSIPSDVYIGRFFMNVWWLSLTFSFSKGRWISPHQTKYAPPPAQSNF
jgi:hypothetical protein